MLKRILLALFVLVVLLVGAMIVVPIVFKDDIIVLANEELNNNLEAEVSLGDVDLTLFQDFPDFTLTLSDLKMTGKETFEGIRLVEIGALTLSLDLMSVINGENIEIHSVGLSDADIHVIVLPGGKANYDIAPSSEEEEEKVEEEGSTEFSLSVQEYFLKNCNVIYDDRDGGLYAEVRDLNHRGSGDFTQDIFVLETKTDASALTYRQDGLAYLNKVALDMDFDVKMNMPEMKFEFQDNYVDLNALHLSFDGMVAMPEEEGDPIDLDMTFATKESSFSGLLSLVPVVFLEDMAGVETEGQLALSGLAKGRMVGETLPAFGLDLTVKDARFQYPDLPKSAENIQIDLHVKNPGGSEDNTVVDLNRFHVELADNPVEMILHMRTPISDPYIDADVKMDLDLASIKDVIPMEQGQELVGQVISDLKLKGNQSAIDQERYQDFDASGSLILKDIDYKDPELPYATIIEVCSLNFSPSYAELTAFKMSLGASDISMTGRVDNVVSWYVADEPLSGNFNFSSQMMDLDELAGSEEEEVESEVEEEYSVIEVPAGYDFVLNTSIDKLIYDGLTVNDLRGKVVLRDQTIRMDHLVMNLLQGSLTMTGTYDTKNPVEPNMDLTMDIIGWDVVETYKYLDIAQKMSPVMSKANGKFSAGLRLSGALDAQMEPNYNTLDGGGSLLTRAIELTSPDALGKAATAIKYDDIKDVSLNDVLVKFQFEDGRINVSPTSFSINKDVPAIFSGSHGFDMTLDYLLNLDIPTQLMGSAASQAVTGLMAQANQALGTNASLPERVIVDLLIGGTSEDPTVTPKFAGVGTGSGNLAGDLKAKAAEELQKQKEELEAKAKAELDKAKAQAEAQAKAQADAAKKRAEAEADAAKKKAQQEADAAKKKLEEEKKKADAAKKKAEEEAKKNLNKLFK